MGEEGGSKTEEEDGVGKRGDQMKGRVWGR